MSDFMMSQVQGLLGKVADDIDRLTNSTASQANMTLSAINDLAANVFATQAILSVMLRDHPVDPAKVKAWINEQTQAAGTEAPKALAVVDQLLIFDNKK